MSSSVIPQKPMENYEIHMKLINLDGSPNINLISHPLAFLRAQAAAATAGRQSPETVDVKGGGVSFRRQQSESGGDITIAETNPEILGKVYIYVHMKLVPMVPMRSIRIHDMGMEVREKEDALGGLGFLASALGEGYFFCC